MAQSFSLFLFIETVKVQIHIRHNFQSWEHFYDRIGLYTNSLFNRVSAGLAIGRTEIVEVDPHSTILYYLMRRGIRNYSLDYDVPCTLVKSPPRS